MKPIVVIDVALLGWAHDHPEYARGVHRVAEQIVSGLIASGACDLRFVATSSLSGAYAALAARWPGMEQRLQYRAGRLCLSRWAAGASAWVERTLSDRRWTRRAARWLAHRLAVWADHSVIPDNALTNAHIYHSPLAPLPQVVRRRAGVKRFLTVHDLIPLTEPEAVEGRGVPEVRRQLESIGADGFAFCVSDTVRCDLLKVTGLARERVFVTQLAVDDKIFYRVTDESTVTAVCAEIASPLGVIF